MIQQILFLSSKTITDDEADALGKYLANVADVAEKRVSKLIVETCSITDQGLCKVLEGIQCQCVDEPCSGGFVQYLQSFVYSNNAFGVKSYQKLKTLTPKLLELAMNNVQFEGGYSEGAFQSSQDLIESILKATAQEGAKLMKLKLTNMNLRFDKTISNLCEVLSNNRNMILLDVSCAQLLSKQLKALSLALAEEGDNMRNLNLSYNSLNFNVDSPEYEDSESFMENLGNFFKHSKWINHVNFSGMNFQKSQILQLLEMIKNSEFLQSIHLSDNGITKDVDFYYDCLDDFMITEEDLIEINRSKRKDAKMHPNK